MSRSSEKSWWQSPWLWGPAGCCLGCVALPLGLAAVLGVGVFGALRSTAVYQDSVEKATRDPRVIEILGEPIEAGWMLQGSVNVSGPSGEADFRVPLSGPRGGGHLYVEAEKSAGEWEMLRLEFDPDDGSQRVDLLEEGAGGLPPPEAPP